MADKLVVDENVTEYIDFSVLGATGASAPVAGWTFEFAVKDQAGTQFIDKTLGAGITITDINAGVGYIKLDPADTKNHAASTHQCQLRAVDGLGNAVKLFQKTFVVKPSVI